MSVLNNTFKKKLSKNVSKSRKETVTICMNFRYAEP